MIGVGIAFFTFMIVLTETVMKNSGAYKVALKEIEQNEEILTETGGIKGYGMMTSGSVSISNGNGQAQLQIKVMGNKKDLNVSVYVTKEPSAEWELKEMKYE